MEEKDKSGFLVGNKSGTANLVTHYHSINK